MLILSAQASCSVCRGGCDHHSSIRGDEQASNMRSDPTAATEAAAHKSDELMSVMN